MTRPTKPKASPAGSHPIMPTKLLNAAALLFSALLCHGQMRSEKTVKLTPDNYNKFVDDTVRVVYILLRVLRRTHDVLVGEYSSIAVHV